MLTRTALLGFRTMMRLADHRGDRPVTPGKLAEWLTASPTYIAKVTGRLVRAGLLPSYRGAHGGVRLAREPGEITMLAMIEACQGSVRKDFCRDDILPESGCAFHQAMSGVHESMVRILSSWTLADLLAKPIPSADREDGPCCVLAGATAPDVSADRLSGSP